MAWSDIDTTVWGCRYLGFEKWVECGYVRCGRFFCWIDIMFFLFFALVLCFGLMIGDFDYCRAVHGYETWFLP